jgi:hypothetical protein
VKISIAAAVLFAMLAFAGAATARPGPAARSVTLGATFTVFGHTGALAGAERSTGAVVMSGRWNAGPWRVIASSRTDSRGRYRLSIKLHRRGILHLRVTPPDGDDHLFVLHVV